VNRRQAPVDKAYRRKIVTITVFFVAIGASVIAWVLPWLREDLQSRDPKEAIEIIKVIFALMFLGVLPLAFYLMAFGRKVMKSECFPPPGVRVIRDTALIEGKEARQRGRAIVVLAWALVLLGLFGALYIPHLLDRIAS
jgi:hypothetical protein